MVDGIKPDGSFGQHSGLLYNAITGGCSKYCIDKIIYAVNAVVQQATVLPKASIRFDTVYHHASMYYDFIVYSVVCFGDQRHI